MLKDRAVVPIISVLNRLYGFSWWIACAIEVAGEIVQLAAPLVLSAFIKYCSESYNARLRGESSTHSFLQGVMLAILVSFMQVFAGFCREQAYWKASYQGAKARMALMACIQRIGQSLSWTSLLHFPASTLLNHLSTDISRLETVAAIYYWRWTEPFSLLIIALILFHILGKACLPSFVLLLAFFPIQNQINNSIYKARAQVQSLTDERTACLKETLNNIYVVKAFTWEEACLSRIRCIRSGEIRLLGRIKSLEIANLAGVLSLPTLMAAVSFSFISMGNVSAEKIFASLTLFNLVFRPTSLLPFAYSAGGAAQLSIARIGGLFDNIPRDGHVVHQSEEEGSYIKAENFSCSWPSLDQRSTGGIRQADFSIHQELVAVVGSIASGKSTLLSAILGHLKSESGSLVTRGQIAYCSQIPWICSGTLRDNILFGEAYDDKRYVAVLRACALDNDCSLMPAYDQSFIGERGSNLSGGQKARLQLARALYSSARILLLDDPLASLDAPTAEHVFAQAIRKIGAGRTVVLITHNITVLSRADKIIQLINATPRIFSSYAEYHATNSAEGLLYYSTAPQDTNTAKESKATDATVGIDEASAMYEQEERSLNPNFLASLYHFLQFGQYRTYAISLCVIWLLSVSIQVLSSQWLIYWHEDRFKWPNARYIQLYVALAVCQASLLGACAFVTSRMGFSASQALHDKALQQIVYANMAFHHTTPNGRIMSRFGKDVDIVDYDLVHILTSQATLSSQLVAAIILCAVIQPLLCLSLIVIALIFLALARRFNPSNRDFKQLSNLLRSHVYSTFSESMSGWAIIKAFQAEPRFNSIFAKAVNSEARAFLLSLANQRWLALRIGSIACLSTLVVSLVAVYQRQSVSPSQIGLALAAIISSQNICEWTMRNHLNLSNHLDSSRRLSYFAREIQTEQTNPFILQQQIPSAELEYKNVDIRYRHDTPSILRGVSFKIAKGTKMAICGRTGAGKSSLINALFRMAEVHSGQILINGMDTTQMDLASLRKVTSLIPQEAALFTGTIRSNLDPTGLASDGVLWNALKEVGLADMHVNSRFSLDAHVSDGGQSFSVGQRALLSLARAFVKNSAIIVLDETTSSLDARTDQIILDAINRIFHDKTVLTIAHRIHSTLSHDLVLVLDRGQVAEFGRPRTLFGNAHGIYRSMCDASGIAL